VNVLFDHQWLANGGHKGQIHRFNGIVYMTIGLEFGVIETAVGFADGSFRDALARRLLRAIARALLIIGLIKGLVVFYVLPCSPRFSPCKQVSIPSTLSILWAERLLVTYPGSTFPIHAIVPFSTSIWIRNPHWSNRGWPHLFQIHRRDDWLR
jgi:hypothetical protein